MNHTYYFNIFLDVHVVNDNLSKYFLIIGVYIGTLRISFPRNENSTGDNEKPPYVCYRPIIVVLFFAFKKVKGLLFELMAIEIFGKEKFLKVLHYNQEFLNHENNTNY